MIEDPRPVDLRNEMFITLARARAAAAPLAHEGQAAPAPRPSSVLPAATEHRATEPRSSAAVPYHPTWRRQVVPLSPEPGSAAAQVLAALLETDTDTDTDTDTLKPALVRLAARNRAILDTDTSMDTLLSALASQLCILEALWHRCLLEAIQAGAVDLKVPLQKVALAAQKAYLRTAVLIASALDAKRIVPPERSLTLKREI